MLLFLVLAGACFNFYVVTRFYSSRPFLCTLAAIDVSLHYYIENFKMVSVDVVLSLKPVFVLSQVDACSNERLTRQTVDCVHLSGRLAKTWLSVEASKVKTTSKDER